MPSAGAGRWATQCHYICKRVNRKGTADRISSDSLEKRIGLGNLHLSKEIYMHVITAKPHNSVVAVVQLLSRVQLLSTLMDCSTPGFLVLHCLPESIQIDVN